MMFSRFYGGVGSYQIGSDFDYFRGGPPSVGREPVKKSKAFLKSQTQKL